jgi:protein KRI1
VKEKYGSDAEESDITDSDSEDDVTEDEDGEELTPALDAAILRTLARIKKKDPEIYNSKKSIFDGMRLFLRNKA